MKLIDIHAHLETKRFEKDLDKVIDRARKKNVIVINSGVNPETNRKALELAEKYGDVVKISFGLYPIDALAKEVESGESNDFSRSLKKFDVDEELKWIEKNKDKCVAIGEIGLDYNWKEFQTEKMRAKQKEVFEKCLKLAKKIDKPVVIHSRKAELDAIEILERMGFVRRDLDFKHLPLNSANAENPPLIRSGVSESSLKSKSKSQTKLPAVIMHCFSSKKSLIKRGVENGWYFSVPPIITRLQHFQTLVEMVPLKQLLTETDSPYLSSVAGERNEPVNVEVTIGEIARIKGLGRGEVARTIFNNAVELFRL